MDGVEAWSRTLTTEQCLAALNDDGRSQSRPIAPSPRHCAIPSSRIVGALAEVEDDGGTFKVMNLPFRMSGAEVSAGRRAATLGEHTLRLSQGGRPFGG